VPNQPRYYIVYEFEVYLVLHVKNNLSAIDQKIATNTRKKRRTKDPQQNIFFMKIDGN
jgi:hypothetical protein